MTREEVLELNIGDEVICRKCPEKHNPVTVASEVDANNFIAIHRASGDLMLVGIECLSPCPKVSYERFMVARVDNTISTFSVKSTAEAFLQAAESDLPLIRFWIEDDEPKADWA